MDNSEAIRHLRKLKERGEAYRQQRIETPNMHNEIQALELAIQALQDREGVTADYRCIGCKFVHYNQRAEPERCFHCNGRTFARIDT